MFDEEKNIDVRELDMLLWLSSPAFVRKRNKHQVLYSEAVKIGKDTAESYPVSDEELIDNLKNFDVLEIEYFTEEAGDRSYYMVDEKKIYLNAYFIDVMSEYLVNRCDDYFKAETIAALLTLHELYHHIEETLTKCTDELLSKAHKTSVSPIYREIAAFSFVNTQRKTKPCQLLDIFWLEKYHPIKYEEIWREYRKGGRAHSQPVNKKE